MKACLFTITTITDGQKTSIIREGEMEILNDAVTLAYFEENAKVKMTLRDKKATIERMGDYSLSLQLICGEVSSGAIGVGGASGAIETFAHKIKYSCKGDSLLLTMQYDLLISGETQKMNLRLLAKYKD